MAYSDRELIARLIQCEAGGEGDNRNESSCDSNYEQSKLQKVNMLEFQKVETFKILYSSLGNLTA